MTPIPPVSIVPCGCAVSVTSLPGCGILHQVGPYASCFDILITIILITIIIAMFPGAGL